MKPGLKVGAAGSVAFVVDSSHVIDFAGAGGMPAILSTPRLVGFLERAAREALTPFLDEGESSVGLHVNVDHLAATPLGETVTCTARVVNLEGRTISFQVEARDNHEVIARCFHRRRVIPIDRFARRVAAKQRQERTP